MPKRTAKSPGKLHKENIPKILKNKLYLLYLDSTFLEADFYYYTYLPIHAERRSASSFFLRENKAKNLRPNEFTNYYAERKSTH